jgi:hypothetical protein
MAIHVTDAEVKQVAEEVRESEATVRRAFDEEMLELCEWEDRSAAVKKILERQLRGSCAGQVGAEDPLLDEPPLEAGEWADPNGCCRVDYREPQNLFAYCWKDEWGHNEDEHRSEVLERWRASVAEQELKDDIERRIAAERIARARNEPHSKGCWCSACARKKKPAANGHQLGLKEQIDEKVRANPQYAYEAVLDQTISPKRDGGKKELYGLCPLHDDHHPSWRMNPSKDAQWYCDPCSKGGDIFTLVALINKWNLTSDFPAVLKWLADKFSLDGYQRNGTKPGATSSSNNAKAAKPQASKRGDDETYEPEPVIPVPENAPDLPNLLEFMKWLAENKIAKDGRTLIPSESEAYHFDYRDEAGKLQFWTIRFDYLDRQADGTEKPGKDVLPATLWRRRDNKRLMWRSKWPKPPRLLFALDKLAAAPDKSPLLVEGERKTELANELPGFKYVAVAFSGGAQRANQSDYSPLAKRLATEWPDNDAPGCRAAIKAAHAIKEARKKVDGQTIESVRIVKPDPAWPGRLRHR